MDGGLAIISGLGALAATALWVAAGSALRRHRRRERWIAEAPLPEAWRRILRRNTPVLRRLPAELARRHETAVKRFLAEKRFTACGGLRRVSDEMAVTVAGHACLLVMGRPAAGVFPGLSSVLVYPDAFVSPGETREAGPELVRGEGGEARVGEYSPYGSIALSWLEIRRDVAHAGNGRNVILHEFAHRLDAEDAAVDGAPAGIGDAAARRAWRRDIGEAFAALRREGEHGVLDPYGAREPAELFAVAVEAFFEDAVRFREAHPALHARFAAHFGFDPAAW